MSVMKARLSDEHGGAMIIAIVVVTIGVALSMAVMSRTSNGLSSSRQNQDDAAALAKADAGVSDAIFRVDQAGSGAVSEFCVGPASAGCTVTSVPGVDTATGGVQYKVQRIDDHTVRVLAKGSENGVDHAVEVEYVRRREFPYGLFSTGEISFNGAADGGGCTAPAIASCTGVFPVDDSDPPHYDGSFDADAGSGTKISCNGSGSPADHHVVNPGGTFKNCPSTLISSGAYDPKDPILGPCPPPENSPPIPCRGEVGDFTSSTNCSDVKGVVTPGRYYCPGNLVFTGDVSVPAGSGTVEFFVVPTSGTVTTDFGGVDVNHGGDPTRFRINMATAGAVDGGNGSHAGRFTGILYAPSASMTNNGCKVELRGAVVIGSYTCNGGPNSKVLYDERVQAIMQTNWVQQNYREIPVGEFSL